MKLILVHVFSLATLCLSGALGEGAQWAAWPGVLAPTPRSEREAILDAVINDILTNPKLRDERARYGTPGDKQFALVSCKDYGVPWPKGYRPRAPGWKVHYRAQEDQIDRRKPRLLGIRLDRFQPDKQGNVAFDAPILVAIFNVGGGTHFLNGPFVGYRVAREKGKYRVICMGWFAA
jgi:hypothetical protein